MRSMKIYAPHVVKGRTEKEKVYVWLYNFLVYVILRNKIILKPVLTATLKGELLPCFFFFQGPFKI